MIEKEKRLSEELKQVTQANKNFYKVYAMRIIFRRAFFEYLEENLV